MKGRAQLYGLTYFFYSHCGRGKREVGKKKRAAYAYNCKQGHCFQLYAALSPVPLSKQTTTQKTPQLFEEQANIANFTKFYMTLHPMNVIV